MTGRTLTTVCVLLALITGVGTARAAEKDTLVLRALTGPKGGDVRITVPAADAGAEIERFEQLKVRLTAPDGSKTKTVDLQEVPAPGGVADIDLGDVERGATVTVDVHVRGEKQQGTTHLQGATTVKVRPDLVVSAVNAAPADAGDACGGTSSSIWPSSMAARARERPSR